MAYYRIEYFSNALRRTTSFEMYIPNDPREDFPVTSAYTDRPMRTLFLLHGYTGKAGNWAPEELAQKYNFCIVMPTAENSFYLDGEATGCAYQRLVGEELVDYVRKTFPVSRKAEDTGIAGLSMGGFGALYTALKHPDVFGWAAGLSSALIVHDVARMKPGDENPIANYAYYRMCFGDPGTLEESDNNPEVLLKKLKAEGKKLPEIYLACGTEDFLIENNRAMHRFLTDEGVKHTYVEGPGIHDMNFWSTYIRKAIPWMFDDGHPEG